MALKTIEHKADRGSVLTLDELAAFVQEAMRSGADGTETVGVTASWGSKIQKIRVDVKVGAAVPAGDATL